MYSSHLKRIFHERVCWVTLTDAIMNGFSNIYLVETISTVYDLYLNH